MSTTLVLAIFIRAGQVGRTSQSFVVIFILHHQVIICLVIWLGAFLFFLLQEIVHMQMRASGLDKKDFLGKSDPFLVFYRANPDGRLDFVLRPELIMFK